MGAWGLRAHLYLSHGVPWRFLVSLRLRQLRQLHRRFPHQDSGIR